MMATILLDTDSDSGDTDVSGSSFVSSGKPSGTLRVEPSRGDNTIDLTEEETDDSADEFPKRRQLVPQRNEGETSQGNQTTLNGASQDSGETSEEDEAPRGSKRRLETSDSPPRSEPDNCSKKPALEEEEPVTDDSEDEGWCSSWKAQEEMVQRLKQKFPSKLKEELRENLLKHRWDFEDTLQSLRLVAEEVSSSEEGPSQQDVTSPPADRPASKTPANAPPLPRQTTNGSANNTFGRTARPPPLQRSSEPGTPENDSWSQAGTNTQILRFFQEASLDELCLINGCSLKKAQKIMDLRPYNKWESLIQTLKDESGLTLDVLQGCRLVLKEQQVVHNLMKKCESISRTMMNHVTQVVESTRGHYKEQPQILNSSCQMKPYQLIGMNWLHLLHQNNVSGILADEMGLGKTIQAIAFLASLYEEGNKGPHLITVPGSTLDNWVRELSMWCPNLKVFVYNGSVEERKSMRQELLNRATNYNIIVSTYTLAINNSSDRSLFRNLQLEYAVFDEGHMLKNMRSQRYLHLMAINAKHRLLLTGTPMQNNLLELMSLLNFIMPEMFSSSTTEMAKMFSMQKSNDEQSTFEKERIVHAKLIIKPFILRRIKSEVLQQMPAKEQKVAFCAMSEKQQQLYDTLLGKLKGSTNGEKRELNNAMMHLRKMANHPLMHKQYYTPTKLEAMSQLITKEPTHHDAIPELVLEDMKLLNDFELHRLCLRYPSIQDYQLGTDLLLDSGKLTYLTPLLATLKSQGDRVVLFSQFTMMLDILEVFLQHNNYRFIRLDGSTPMSDRIVLIDQFNTEMDIFVFLLSTKAGGLGINLTSANVVILHDIDCNPYNDKQAEDRCHRVGQTRLVRVTKLISKDTIEDTMLRIGEKKLKLEQDMTTTQEGEEGSIPEDMASALKASLGL